MNILLIAGWGLGLTVLEEFAEKLRRDHTVAISDIFDPFDAATLQEKIKLAQHMMCS